MINVESLELVEVFHVAILWRTGEGLELCLRSDGLEVTAANNKVNSRSTIAFQAINDIENFVNLTVSATDNGEVEAMTIAHQKTKKKKSCV